MPIGPVQESKTQDANVPRERSTFSTFIRKHFGAEKVGASSAN